MDRRLITGAPAWLEPAKFALSTDRCRELRLLYCIDAYLAASHGVLDIARSAARAIDIALIDMQAARATTSHFTRAPDLMVLSSL